MPNSRILIILAAVAGVALLVVAGVYFAEPAKSLPSFFPGYDASYAGHHTKHGIAALVVALGCFAFAWFQSGPRTARA
ncbi:MAG: hypothetical protein ACR2KV_07340 [Solirubrobacteraceae bacterium]